VKWFCCDCFESESKREQGEKDEDVCETEKRSLTRLDNGNGLFSGNILGNTAGHGMSEFINIGEEATTSGWKLGSKSGNATKKG